MERKEIASIEEALQWLGSEKKAEDLRDGVYGILNGTKYTMLHDHSEWNYSDKNLKKIAKFLNTIDQSIDTIYYVAPYETSGLVLLDMKPIEIPYDGEGFNYGSCNIVTVPENCSAILIAAEND